MADKITIVEFNMEPAELLETVQVWATETKFSVHEQNEKRVVYRKSIGINNNVWLSIEHQDQNKQVTLGAWFGAKNMGPDVKGSAWKGWKTPIPAGFAIGLTATYKKHFNKLIEMLESKSGKIVTSKSTNQTGIEKNALVKGLSGFGIIQIVIGTINLISGSSFISSYPDLGNVTLANGLFSIFLGILTFMCSRMLKNNNAMTAWLYGFIVLLNVAYSTFMGHKLPYFSMFFGALIVWQLVNINKQQKVSL